MRRSYLLVIVSFLINNCFAWGQLSQEAIEELGRRLAEEGHSFSLGENDSTNRSLQDLCGFRPPQEWPPEGLRGRNIKIRQDVPAEFDWRE